MDSTHRSLNRRKDEKACILIEFPNSSGRPAVKRKDDDMSAVGPRSDGHPLPRTP